MVNPLESTFLDVYIGLRGYRLNKSNLPALEIKLAKLEKLIKQLSPGQLSIFVDENKLKLHHVKNLLVEQCNPNPPPSRRTVKGVSIERATSLRPPVFRSFYDRIIKGCLGMSNDDDDSISISAVLKEFIKGITYFSDQHGDEVPIYHRLYSCGATDDDAYYREWHKCRDTMNDTQRAEVEQRITTCYIERLIYDNIYVHLHNFFPPQPTAENKQNPGHLDRLEVTRKDYKTCFPSVEIKIDVEYTHEYPYILRITKLVNDTPRYTEIYKKEINRQRVTSVYEDVVECFVHKSSGIFYKYQTFERRETFKRVILDKTNELLVPFKGVYNPTSKIGAATIFENLETPRLF